MQNDEQNQLIDINRLVTLKKIDEKKRLEEAILEAEQKGKEPFDYEKFIDSYWKKNTFSQSLDGNESDKMAEYYKMEYYLEFPEVMSVEEFALALEKRDASIEG